MPRELAGRLAAIVWCAAHHVVRRGRAGLGVRNADAPAAVWARHRARSDCRARRRSGRTRSDCGARRRHGPGHHRAGGARRAAAHDSAGARIHMLGAGPLAGWIALDTEGAARARPASSRPARSSVRSPFRSRNSVSSGKATSFCISPLNSSRRLRHCLRPGRAIRSVSRGAACVRGPSRSLARLSPR